MEMSDSRRSSLIAANAIVALPSRSSDGEVVYRVEDLEVAFGVHIPLPAITIRTVGSPADKGIGITEDAVVYLGFQALSQFKTVWDWSNHMIYLLVR